MENLSATLATTDTQLYETFRETLGKDKAETTVGAIKHMVHSEMENKTQVLATRDQLAETKEQLAETKEQIAALEVRIYKTHFQIIFWIVSIGVLQVVASYLLRA